MVRQEQDILVTKPFSDGDPCQDIRRHQATGGLRADRHETAVEGDHDHVAYKPESEQPNSRHLPVEPAENQEQDLGEDEPGSRPVIR